MARLPLRPIADYFPAEPGRRPPAAAGKCWQTNSLKTTGGYIGGVAAYRVLLRARAANRRFYVSARRGSVGRRRSLTAPARWRRCRWRRGGDRAPPGAVRRTLSLRRLGRRHGVGGGRRAATRVRGGGVRLDALGDAHVRLTFQKPSVVVAGSARRPTSASILASAARVRGARCSTLRARGLFGGRAWARTAWRGRLRRAGRYTQARLARRRAAGPAAPAATHARAARRAAGGSGGAEAAADGDGWPTLGETLGVAGGAALGVAPGLRVGLRGGRATCCHDNRRVMHDGLPGFGPRQLRAPSSTRSRCRRRWSGGAPGCLTRGSYHGTVQ